VFRFGQDLIKLNYQIITSVKTICTIINASIDIDMTMQYLDILFLPQGYIKAWIAQIDTMRSP
jgi:hypothetical protein